MGESKMRARMNSWSQLLVPVFWITLILMPSSSVAGVRNAELVRMHPAEIQDQVLDEPGSASSPSGTHEGGSPELFRTALKRQLQGCSRFSEVWNFDGRRVTRDQWCDQVARWFLKELDAGLSLSAIFKKAKSSLEWYRSTGKPDSRQVEFTGYYAPIYRAKLKPEGRFQYPIYRLPPDLHHPSFTRAEIEDRKVLLGRGLEIAYLDNPIDPYLLQVQGSGTLLIQNDLGVEERIIVNFSGENGWPYTSLGKLMRAAGVPDEYISLQGIKRYFTDVHPELWSKFSNQNLSYVFFKKATEGPFGASAALLTPKHSIAIDPKVFPLGAIGLIQAERPFQVTGDLAQDWRPFSQFVVAQDTGGAIQGPGRVDVFWGEGHYAEVVAGQSDRMGELYFVLVPQSKKSGLRHP